MPNPSPDIDEISLEIEKQLEANKTLRRHVWNGDKDFSCDGLPAPGTEAGNIEKHGFLSPYHHYCFSMPGISAKDLAAQWGVKYERVVGWLTRGNWNAVRRQWLAKVPVHGGGTMMDADEESDRRQFISQSRAVWQEVMDNTMEMMRKTTEQEASFDALNKIDIERTADSQLKLARALEIANQQMRLAYALPNRLTMQVSQTSHQRVEVTESVVHAPAAPKTYDLGAAIDPPALPPIKTTTTYEVAEEVPQ